MQKFVFGLFAKPSDFGNGVDRLTENTSLKETNMEPKDNPYNLLDISPHTAIILKRLRIQTIDDLLKIKTTIIAAKRGVGVKTVSEIIKLQDICNDKLDRCVGQFLLFDTPAEKIVKDYKSRYILKYFNISTIGDMLQMELDTLKFPRGYGKLTRNKIKAYIKDVQSKTRIEKETGNPGFWYKEEDEPLEITTFSSEAICNLFPFFGALTGSRQKKLAIKQLNLDRRRISSIYTPSRINYKFSDSEALTRLLETPPSECLRVDGFGKGTLADTRKCLLNFISELRRHRCEERCRPKNDLKNFPLFNPFSTKTSPKDHPGGFEANRSIKWLRLNKHLSNILEKMDISTIGQLLSTETDAFYDQKDCGGHTLGKIRKAFEDYHVGQNWKPDMSSPVSMLEDIFKREGKDPRMVGVLTMRNGVAREGGMTLEKIGGCFNVTLERIRQIDKRAWSVLEQPFNVRLFRPCFDALHKALSEKSNLLSLHDAQSRFQELMKWSDVLPIGFLIRLHGKFDRDDFVFRLFRSEETEYIWLTHAACYECERLVAAMRNRAIQDGILSVEKWVQRLVRGISDTCSNCTMQPVASRELGYYFLEKIHGSGKYIVEESSTIYTGKAIHFRRGSIRKTILAILEDAPGAMTTKEIANRLCRLRPEKKNRVREGTILGNINQTPEAILWGRGGYLIHRKHVRTRTPLLARLERDMIDLVKSDASSLSARRLFLDNSQECTADGIPNEYALYSCLKLRNSPNLSFVRAPFIALSEYAGARLGDLLYMAVRQREGAVTINSLAASLGVDIQNVKNRLSALPDIIRNEKNELLSLNEIDTKSPSFLTLMADIERLVDIHGSISCMGIFKKKQVICMDVGITDPTLLFDVVSAKSDSLLGVSRDLMLQKTNRRPYGSSTEALLAHLGELNSVFTLVELKKMVSERGFTKKVRSSILSRPEIIKFSGDMRIHRDVLNWSAEKQEILARQAIEEYRSARQSGACFGNCEELLDRRCDDLPTPGANVPLTPELISSLLKPDSRFSILGNREMAYAVVGEGPDTLEAVVREILLNEFDGAANMEEFSGFLSAAGLVIRNLTRSMVRPGCGIGFNDLEIFLETN